LAPCQVMQAGGVLVRDCRGQWTILAEGGRETGSQGDRESGSCVA
jgi:hypothetical protein